MALLGHAPALRGGTEHTYDDHAIVGYNPRLTLDSLPKLVALVTDNYWGDIYSEDHTWRPLPLLSYAVERSLHGNDPDLARWASAILHALTAAAAYSLFLRLSGARGLALLAALLFAIHPVHAEATGGVVGRAEVLALLFSTLGLVLHLRGRAAAGALARWGWTSAAAVCFFLGLTSKEIAAAAPVVLAVLELLWLRPGATPERAPSGSSPAGSAGSAGLGGPEERAGPAHPTGILRKLARLLGPYALYAGALAAYLVCRHLVLGGLAAGQGARTLGDMGLDLRLLVAAEVARDALFMLLWGQPTSAAYPFDRPAWDRAAPVASFVIQAGLGLAAVWLLVRARRGRSALVRRAPEAGVAAMALVATYLSLGPVLNLIPIGVVRADRLLYTPSLFGALLLASLLGLVRRAALAAAPGRPRLGAVFAAALVALLVGRFTTLLAFNLRAWTSDERLWRATVARYPGEARGHLGLAGALRTRVERGEESLRAVALEHYRTAARLFSPERWPRQAAQARVGIAACLRDEQPERSLELLLEARAIAPRFHGSLQDLTQHYLRAADRAQDPGERLRLLRLAERCAREGANRVAPHEADMWIAWGNALFQLEGRERDAESAYTQAALRSAFPWQAWFNRARVRRLGLQDWAGAYEDYRAVHEALALLEERGRHFGQQEQDALAESLLFRGVLAAKLGDPHEAEALLRAAQARFPQYVAQQLRAARQ